MKKVIYSVHAIYGIAMKAKGNDQSQAFGTKEKKVNPAGYRTLVARFVVERASHYSTKPSRKGGDALVLLISLGYIVVQYEFTRWQSTIRWWERRI
jgi:hypothetical protein